MSIVDAGSPERLKACKGIFQFLATGTLLFDTHILLIYNSCHEEIKK